MSVSSYRDYFKKAVLKHAIPSFYKAVTDVPPKFKGCLCLNDHARIWRQAKMSVFARYSRKEDWAVRSSLDSLIFF